jgi:thiol-disulfide isomerase/thioredoxin
MDSKYGGTSVIELGNHDFQVKRDKTKVVHQDFHNKLGLVKFYAPWCPHCTDMVDTLSYLSDQLKDYGFKVSAVNCDDTSKQNDQLAQKIGVEGFPSLYFINSKGELKDYTGGRDLKSLLTEVVKMSRQGA